MWGVVRINRGNNAGNGKGNAPDTAPKENGSILKREITRTQEPDGRFVYKVIYLVHPGEDEYETIAQEWKDDRI